MIVDVKQIRDPFSRVVVVVRMMRRSAESGSRLLAAVTTPVAQSPCSSTTTTTTTTAAMIKIGSNYGFVALLVSLLTLALITSTSAFTVPPVSRSVSASTCLRAALQTDNDNNNDNDKTVVVESSSSTTNAVPSRRAFLGTGLALAATAMVATLNPQPAEAVGPVKVTLLEPKYFAQPCPPSRPIPGEKAMKGMRGLCVTVDAKLDGGTPKDLEKVGVYGFVTDADTGESVLANNPDLSTDAGQFAMIESVTTKDEKVQFDFVAAVPKDKDISQFENGIGPLSFNSLRIISFPGGQQYGAISPCEMNEFSQECEDWENENGPYQKGEFMVKSNPRTKGR